MGYQTKDLLEDKFDWVVDTADSASDVFDFAKSDRYAWGARVDSSRDLPEDFTGTKTFNEAMRLARLGWKEGRDKLAERLDAANFVQLGAMVRAERLDVAGAFPFVPAAVSGDPMCMTHVGLEQTKTRPIYRFLVSISALARFSADNIINRGAAILSWADKLEAEGARVEIICVRSTDWNRQRYFLSFPLKRADEPLDIDRAAFVLVHPSMLRRIVFSCMEKHERLSRFRSYYGQSSNGIPKELRVAHSIYFPALTEDVSQNYFKTPETALTYVSGIITKALTQEDVEARAAA